MVVSLRNLALEDASLLYRELGCDPEMNRFTGWNPYADKASAAAFVEESIAGHGRDSFSWMVMADGDPVGIVAAYDLDAQARSAEIGYSVFRRFWGRGYAKQAVRLAVRRLMNDEKLLRLTAWTAADNIASVRVLEACGMASVAVEPEGLEVGGELVDRVFYAIQQDL